MKQDHFWIKDRWDERRGRSISIKINQTLESFQSKFQKIDVYQSECFGKILTLDDVIMITDFDEFAYHEMIAHVPLHTHPNPQKVLVIGGGDGGTAREILKHDLTQVHLCEIDEAVVQVCKQHFPNLASSFSDPRMTVFYDDGAQFITKHQGEYDVIIVDSSDPWGPAEVLFQESFYTNMQAALNEGGIVVSQSESMFYDKNTIGRLFDFNPHIYPIVKYYYTLVPTYPSGTIGFSFCSKKYDPLDHLRVTNIKGLKYYNREMHLAAFELPNFMRDIIHD